MDNGIYIVNIIKIAVKVLLVILLILTIPFIIVHFTRLTNFVGVTDPIEQAIVKAFDNKNLVIGSKLNNWVEELGEPDLVVKFEFTYEPYERVNTEYYWLEYGIVAVIEGEHDSIDTTLESKVDGILIPTQKILPRIYMKSNHRIRTINNVDDTGIEFNQLLNASLNGNTIKEITVQDINAIYPNQDMSNHDYYTIPFPFITHRTWLYCVRHDKTQGHSTVCLDDFYLISLNNGDLFTFKNYLKLIWGVFIVIPYHIVTGK